MYPSNFRFQKVPDSVGFGFGIRYIPIHNESWSVLHSTLVVKLNDRVYVQFNSRNETPNPCRHHDNGHYNHYTITVAWQPIQLARVIKLTYSPSRLDARGSINSQHL